MQNILGKDVAYPHKYDPSVLYGIERINARKQLSIADELPFQGVDLWRCYEFSWLNQAGKPESRILEIRVPCESKKIVESKSLKLFLGSFAQEKLSEHEVNEAISKPLAGILGCNNFSTSLNDLQSSASQAFIAEFKSLDDQQINISDYQYSPGILKSSDKTVSQKVFSNSFRSLCPVTGQPDWATVLIEYQGRLIEPDSLLKYLVSFRTHQGFHEEECERIFTDIDRICDPEKLLVACYFTRRGGIDITPIRSKGLPIEKYLELRTIRQ